MGLRQLAAGGQVHKHWRQNTVDDHKNVEAGPKHAIESSGRRLWMPVDLSQ